MRRRWPRVLAAITFLSVVIWFILVPCSEKPSLWGWRICRSQSTARRVHAVANPKSRIGRKSAGTNDLLLPCSPVIPAASQQADDSMPAGIRIVIAVGTERQPDPGLRGSCFAPVVSSR
jgi:hypothetical protein